MATNVPIVIVFDAGNGNHIEDENATYREAAAFVVDHPRREHLRVSGDGIAEPMTADDFLRWMAQAH